MALASERELDLCCLAVAGLRHLSLNDELKRPIVDSGALLPVVRSVAWANEDLQCQCAGLIANLSENQENQVCVWVSWGVPP